MDSTTGVLNDANEIPNPFIHRLEYNSMYERIKVAIMSVTAAPIRAFALLVTLTVAWMIAVGGLIGYYDKDVRRKPLSKLRREIMKPVLCQILRILFFCGGWHWISVKGKQASSKEAPILALAPHSSFFDAVAMAFIGGPSVVAKSEIRSSPCFGTIISYCEPIYVSREDPNSRQSTIQEITRRSNDDEWSHSQVAIFPEGTCTNRTCLITFKPGAFLPGVPIQPVCLKYKNKNDVVTWTHDGPSAIKLFWTSLCQFYNSVEIEFLPVYVPSELEKRDPVLYAKNVREIMAKCLDLPVLNCTYGDHPIILKTLCSKFPIESHLTFVQQLRTNLKLGLPRSELSRYLEFTKSNEDLVNLSKFSDYLQVSSSSDFTPNLFNTYVDEKNTGVINFRDYLLDLCLLCGPVPESEPPIRLAFQALDKTGRMELSQEDIEKILSKTYNLSSSESLKIFQSMDVNTKRFVTYDDFLSFTKRKSFFYKLFVGFGSLAAEGHESTASGNESPSKMKSE